MSKADSPKGSSVTRAARRRTWRFTMSIRKQPYAGPAPALVRGDSAGKGDVMLVPRHPISNRAAPKPTAGSELLEKLRATGVIGMWKDRDDMTDSTAFVHRLREQIQVRADRTTPAE